MFIATHSFLLLIVLCGCASAAEPPSTGALEYVLVEQFLLAQHGAKRVSTALADAFVLIQQHNSDIADGTALPWYTAPPQHAYGDRDCDSATAPQPYAVSLRQAVVDQLFESLGAGDDAVRALAASRDAATRRFVETAMAVVRWRVVCDRESSQHPRDRAWRRMLDLFEQTNNATERADALGFVWAMISLERSL